MRGRAARSYMAMAWASKDACVAQWLDDSAISELRASSSEWRDAIDATLTRLRPVSIECEFLAVDSTCRTLPALKSLLLDHPKLLLQPYQLQSCSQLTQLTQLHLGGPACFHLRSHHLSWISSLVRLQDLKLKGCTKVRVGVVSGWHPLQQLHSLCLIGLAFTAADAPALHAFLAAGSCNTLTSLVLGDQQGLSFLSDTALEGLGALLSPSCRLQVLDLSGCIELTDAGIQQLRGLGPSLQHLQLHNCMKISSGAAQLIGTFNHLTALNLRGCCQLSDDSLAALLSAPVCLQQLNLQSCSGLSGAFLAAAASKLARLAELNLSYCTALQPLQLTALQKLPVLRRLCLAGCAVVNGPDVLLVLGGLRGLTHLDGSSWTCKGELGSLTAGAAAAHNSSSSGDANRVAGSGSSSSSFRVQEGGSSSDERPTQQENSSSSSSSSRSGTVLIPPQLQSLKLSELNCNEALLEGLVNQLPKTLTSLDLSSFRVAGVGLRGSSLKGIQGLSNLQVLNLSGTTGGVFATDISFLWTLSSLTKLQIDHIHAGVTAAVPDLTAATAAARAAAGADVTKWVDRAAAAAAAAMENSTACRSNEGSSSSSACSTVLVGHEEAATAGRASSSSGSSSSSAGGVVSSVCTTPPGTAQQLPHSPQQQFIGQQQQQQQTAGVAALLLGLAQPGSGNTSSQGSAADSAEVLNPTPAMEPLELGDSTTAISPPQMMTAATAAAVSAAAAATGGVSQSKVGSRAGSTNSSSSVRRLLFPHGCAAAQQTLTHVAAATERDAAAGSSLTQAALQQQQEQQQQQQESVCVTTGPTPWLQVPGSVQEFSVSFSPGLGDAELASLGGVRALRSIDLLADHGFTGVGFSSWSALSALTCVRLTGCSGLCDAGLSALAVALAGVLRELQLPGCRGVSDVGVAALSVVTGLRALNLSSNRALTGRCLSGLFPGLRQLRSLGLSLCGGMADDALTHLADAPSLAQLDLHCCWRLTDGGMHALLSRSRSLMHVNIDGCPRLTLASCPPCFIAVDALVGGRQLEDSSSIHRRPGVIIRVPT